MKKFVAMMAMVIMMLMAMTTGMAAESVRPAVHLNDLGRMSWGDDYDLHITTYMTMPEYEDVRLEMNISFNDNSWENYNHGVAKLYDNSTGELIDETEGNLTVDVDCSSKDIETVRRNMIDYVNNYDFDVDAERGVRYFSVWF